MRAAGSAGLAVARAWPTAVLVAVTLGAAAAAADPAPRVVVHLPHGGTVAGRLLDADAAWIRLQADIFSEPLELPVGASERIRFAGVPAAVVAGAWCELRSGDVVVGGIESADDDRVVIAPASPRGAPPVTIPRGLVAALEPADAGRVILPGDAAGWTLPDDAWRIEDGILTCSTRGGTAACGANIARRTCFDLVLAWRERPDFDLSLGAADAADGAAKTEAYRLEATAGTVLAVRETGAVKFEEVARLAAGAGRLAVRVFVDRDAGRMAVVVRDPAAGTSRVAFDETVSPRRDEAAGVFFVRLRRGDLRIERLRVVAWDGAAVTEPAPAAEPRAEPPADTVAVSAVGGGRLSGRLLGVADGTIRLASSLATEPLALSISDILAIEPMVAAQPPALPGTVGRLSAGDATLLGCLVGTGADGVPGWQPLGGAEGVPFAGPAVSARIVYRGLDVLGGVGLSFVRRGDEWQVADVAPRAPAERSGRIRPGDRVMAISQGDGPPVATRGRRDAEMRALVAGPIGSTVTLDVAREGSDVERVDLVRDAVGRDDLAGAAPRDVLDRALVLQQALGDDPKGRTAAAVYLRSGDMVSGTVLAIASGRIRVAIPAAGEPVEIDDAQVKALEFGGGTPRPLARQKLSRLLTLPRSQQAAPPRHVLRTVGGDFLRGTLVSLDDALVRFEMAGIEKRLHRRDVARIIWLDAEPQGDTAAPAGDGLPAVVVGTDGRRLSLTSVRVEGKRLVGTSSALGPMQVGLRSCQELFLGGAAASLAAAEKPYEQWVLTPAVPPRGAAGDRGAR